MIDEHEIRYCDRCGAACEVVFFELVLDSIKPADHIDLCGHCWQQFKNWIAKGAE